MVLVLAHLYRFQQEMSRSIVEKITIFVESQDLGKRATKHEERVIASLNDVSQIVFRMAEEHQIRYARHAYAEEEKLMDLVKMV